VRVIEAGQFLILNPCQTQSSQKVIWRMKMRSNALIRSAKFKAYTFDSNVTRTG